MSVLDRITEPRPLTVAELQAEDMGKALAVALANDRHEGTIASPSDTQFQLGLKLNNSPFANRWQNPRIVTVKNKEAHQLQQTFSDKSLKKHLVIKRIAKNESSFVEVDLRDRGLTDASARAIGRGLLTNTHLTRLNLGGNAIGDSGATALASALKTNTTLRFLHLKYCKIGDDGAEAFADMLGTNETLHEVNLSFNTAISDEQRETLSILINSDEPGGALLVL